MAYMIKVTAFREDTGQTMAGVPVSLSLSGFSGKTDGSGQIKFKVPENSGDIYIYVNGKEIPKHGYAYELRDVDVYVSASGYFSKMV